MDEEEEAIVREAEEEASLRAAMCPLADREAEILAYRRSAALRTLAEAYSPGHFAAVPDTTQAARESTNPWDRIALAQSMVRPIRRPRDYSSIAGAFHVEPMWIGYRPTLWEHILE